MVFIPKCQNCGRCGCSCGRFPYTVTLTVDGLENKVATYHQVYNPFAYPPLTVYTCELSAQACFGFGAEAKITQPGGCYPTCPNEYCPPDNEWPYLAPDDSGPISEVKVTDPGQCYAKLGRVQPTIVAVCKPSLVEGGLIQEDCSEVSLTVTLAQGNTQCDGQEIDDTEGTFCDSPPCLPLLPFWYISNIEIESADGLCEYDAETPVSILVDINDTVVEPAEFVMRAADGVPYDVIPKVVNGEEKRGRYYRESKDVPPYVAEVRFELATQCLRGLGEEDIIDIRGVVGDDPYSPSFGRVIGTQILNGGYSWLAWTWAYVCHKRQNGKDFVLAADDPIQLITIELDSCFGSGACFPVNAFGERMPPSDLQLTSFPPAGSLYYSGCNGNFSYDLQKTKASDDGDAWTISKISASGGKYWLPNASARDTSLCTVYEEPVEISLTTGVDGTILNATLDYGGLFYLETPYDGQPGPIKKIGAGSPGGGYAKLGRAEPVGLRPYWLKKEGLSQESIYLDENTNVEVVLEQRLDACGVDYWEVEEINADDFDFLPRVRIFEGEILIDAGNNTTLISARWLLTIYRDEQGEITEYTMLPYRKGQYCKEDASLSPYVTGYGVVIKQSYPSQGSGAQVKVTIDQDTKSETFGQVTKVEIENGGSGYTILGSSRICHYSGVCSHRTAANATVPDGGWNGDGDWGPFRGSTDIPLGFLGGSVASLDAKTDRGRSCLPATCGGTYAISSYLGSIGGVDCDIAATGGLENVDGQFDGNATLQIAPGGIYNPCRIDEETTHDCGYCPDFRKLCMTAVGTDWQGNKETISNADCTIAYSHNPTIRCTYPAGDAYGWHEAAGYFENIAIGNVSVICDNGKISITATGGPTGEEDPPYPLECGNCTSWSGSEVIECDESEDWYIKTVTITLQYDSPEFCEGCPDPGSVEVTITRC